MTFQLISSQRLYHQVADQVAGRIRAGELLAGARLPSERDLSKQLGVSRPTVREAMIALEIAGLVEVRTGAGVFVQGNAPVFAKTLDVGSSPFDLLHARRLIEGETSALAALAHTSDHLQRMEQALRPLVAAIRQGAVSNELDRVFHVSIAAASGNLVLAEVVDGLWGAMVGPLFKRLEQRFPVALEGNAVAHERIFEAIAARDPPRARAAMQAHLDSVELFFMGDAGDKAKSGQKPA